MSGVLHAWGAVAAIGTLLLAMRLVWEQTLLAWTRGPQMVGFSLVHSAFVLLFLFPLLLAAWVAVVGVLSVWRSLTRRPVPGIVRIELVVAVLLLVLVATPEQVWYRTFAGRLAKGPHAADFLAHAVATGDSATTAALVARGVPIDERGPGGETLLHLAARRGHEEVMEVLLSHGADPNALNGFGVTPLDEALSAEQRSAADWLRSRVGDRLQAPRARVTDKVVVTVTPEP